jgi:hypothetical protein
MEIASTGKTVADPCIVARTSAGALMVMGSAGSNDQVAFGERLRVQGRGRVQLSANAASAS